MSSKTYTIREFDYIIDETNDSIFDSTTSNDKRKDNYLGMESKSFKLLKKAIVTINDS